MFVTLTVSEACPDTLYQNYKEIIKEGLKNITLLDNDFLLVKVYLDNTKASDTEKICSGIRAALNDLGLTKFIVVPLNGQVKDVKIEPILENLEAQFAQLCLAKLKKYITDTEDVTLQDWIHWDTVTGLIGVEGRNALVNFNFLDIENDDAHFSYWYRIKEEYYT